MRSIVIAPFASLVLVALAGCTVTTTSDGEERKPAAGPSAGGEEGGGAAEGGGASSGSSSGGVVPAPLAGRWYQGNLSTIQVYDDATGSWAPPNGTGIFYIFEPDGRYTYGGILNTTYGMCTSQLYVQEKGTVSVSGPAFTTHRQAGRSFVDNNCGEDAERILEPEEKLYGWRVVVEDGREKLVLVWPDGSKDSFERWEE